MKKKLLIAATCLLIGCVSTICSRLTKLSSAESSLTLENVEALAGGDTDVTIVCSSGHDGKCFRKGMDLKFCHENSYYECKYTGYTFDYCKNPC